jgi:hypothetical protein
MKSVKQLYERLRGTPWPTLGGTAGNLPMYEALLAGCADRVSRGEHLSPSEIPTPDDESVERINDLRAAAELSADERALLEYFELLEEIRGALQRSRA